MAASAQSVARAAVGGKGLAAMSLSGNNARIVSLELFHVTKNLTEQIAMGVSPLRAFTSEIGRIGTAVQYSGGIKGLIGSCCMTGVLKVTRDAELDEAAAAALAGAAAVKRNAESAASTLLAKQAQVALAKTQLEVVAGTELETAAMARLVKAQRAVADQSATLAGIQQTLATVNAEAAVASEAASAATVTSIGRMGVAIGTTAVVAGVLFAALEDIKHSAASDAELKQYAASLGATTAEMKKLKDVTVTWGDLTKATFQVLAEKAGVDSKSIGSAFSSAFHSIGEFGKFSVAIILAAFGAMVKGVGDVIMKLPAIVGGGIAAAANLGIAALEKMVNLGVNKLSAGINDSLLGKGLQMVFGAALPHLADVSLGRVHNSFVTTMKSIGADVSGTFHDIFNRTEATFNAISLRAESLRDKRVTAQAEDMLADTSNRAAKAHHERAAAANAEAASIDKLHQALEKLMGMEAKVDLGGSGPLSKLEGPGLSDVLAKLPDFGAQLLETLRAISDQAAITGQVLADAFGKAGGVLGNLLSGLARYTEEQQRLSQAVAAGTTTQANADKALANLRLSTIASTIHGLKTMFKEHSVGYKAMEAAERAFAIITAIQTVKDVAAGAAKMFKFLGPFAFPAVAAMLGVMAALGFGGGGHSSATAPTSPEDLQKAAGAGTVLGDATAKSDSIAHSLDIMAQNSTKGLDQSSDMVRSLRSIESNIGNLAAAIAREFQAGAAFDTSGLGLGKNTSNSFSFIGAALGGLVGGLLGGKKTVTTSLFDQGLQLNSATVQQIVEQGITGATYDVIEKITKKSGLFGIGASTKTSYSTVTGALPDGVSRQFQLIIGDVYNSVVGAAKVLGLDVGAALKTFQIEIGKISFKDLKGDEITKALEAVFSKVADQMAGFAVAGLEQFQKAGEGLFETLSRLAKDYLTVDAALKSIGKTFGSVGVASVAMREKLIGLAGGLDAFVSQVNFFYDHFLTDAQKSAILKAQVDATFKTLGIAVPGSIAAFAKLVTGANLSTDAGQKLFEALMQIAPAFYEVATAADQLIAKQKDDLVQAYKRESDALQQTADKFHKFAAGLREFRDGLFTTANGSLSYNQSLVALMKQAGLAAGGNEDALGGGLQQSAEQFLSISEANAKSLADVERARAMVARYLDQAIGGADSQASIAEMQLKQLHDQVDRLVDIDQHVQSVAEAIKALTQLMSPHSGGGGAHHGHRVSKEDILAAGDRGRHSVAHDGQWPERRQDQATAEHLAELKDIKDHLEAIGANTATAAVSGNKLERLFGRIERNGALAVATDSDTPIQTQAV
jgi:hypothetical protein